MLTFKRVLFIIAFFFLCIHCVRLTYIRWLEPHGSVLDKYQDVVEVEIKEADSIEDLLARYDEAHKELEQFKSSAEYAEMEVSEQYESDQFQREEKLRKAVQDWERQSNLISKNRFYWILGLLFLPIGIALHKWINPILGVASLMVGFSEMIFWSSPAYFGSFTSEYARLLDNQLVLAFSSLALLLISFWLVGGLRRSSPPPCQDN